MRIDNWPLDRIMRLPDWCFGRRWWVGDYLGNTEGRFDAAIGQENLPDKFVVWGVMTSARSPNCLEAIRLTMRLGTFLATGIKDLNGMERLLKGISIPTIVFELYVNSNGLTWIKCERQIIESEGRRLCYGANGDQTIAYEITAAMLISSLPKEVPDWLVKGNEYK